MPDRTEPPPHEAGNPARRNPDARIGELTDKLAASEARLQLALDIGGMGIWQADLNTLDIMWWPGMAAIHGLAPEAAPLPMREYRDLIHPDDRERVPRELRDTIRRKGDSRVEYRVLWPDGSTHWVEARAKVLLDEQGSPWAVAGVCLDVTQRKRVENDLKFLATLAHELRNPLAPISNGLAIIKRAPHDAARVEQLASLMERQVGHLTRLVDDLLDVSRISTGKIELKKETANLLSILRSAIETSRSHIHAGQHKLSVEFPDEPIELEADPVRMAQVFSNLLNNAAKFTSPGGHIQIFVQAEPERIVVTVRDNGAGIAPEMLQKVFGLFTQVTHPAERSQGGLGIGLSLVDGLVRLHGGTVEARSEGPQKGSEFIVNLPRILRTAAPGGGCGEARGQAGAAQANRILVVDDNQDAAETLAELLTMLGNEVAVALDGASAIDRVTQFGPDIVLLDIGLPDLNGYEVARRVRRLESVRQPQLIALTGWAQQQDKRLAAEAGFDQHWTKPVDIARLQALSRNSLERAAL